MNIHLLQSFALVAAFLFSFAAQTCPEYRISEEEKQILIDELTNNVKKYRAEQNGKIGLQEFGKEAEEYLYPNYVNEGYVGPNEIKQLENNYAKILGNENKLSDDQKEKLIIETFTGFIEWISGMCKKGVGEICFSNKVCQKGLLCIDANAAKELIPSLRIDCGNNQCYKKSICISEEKTLPAGPQEHCTSTFGCSAGLFCYSQTFFQSGYVDAPGAPYQLHESCTSSRDCNSNLCENGKCVKNNICTNCTVNGQSASDANQCCTKNLKNNICRPNDLPNKTSQVIIKIFNQLIVPTYADDDSSTTSNGPEAEDYIKSSNFKIDYDGKYQGEPPKSTTSEEDHDIDNSTVKKEVRNFSSSAFEIPSTSDFTTCKINLKADYLQFLKDQSTTDDDGNSFNLLDLEYSFLAYEFVTMGPGTIEFWKSNDGKSFHETMSAVANSRMTDRNKVFGQLTTDVSSSCDLNLKTPTDITNNNLTVPGSCSPYQKITCICYDRIGYPSLSEEQQSWFKNYCGELYVLYEAEKEAIDAACVENGEGSGSGSGSGSNNNCKLYEGDPTGQKYRLMLIGWVQQMINIQELFMSINVTASESLYNLKKYIQTKNWGDGTQLKKIELYSYTVSPYSNLYTSMAAIIGALLACGVIAILSSLSIPFSAWISAGFITASMGTAMIVAALHGAWSTKAPYLEDEITRSMYKCGKKDQCQDYKRVLYQPYNQVCNAYISANACIKYIKTANFRGQERYLLDPFVPYGMNAAELINDNRLFAALLNNGFKRLITELDKKKQTGDSVSEDHLITPFIDPLTVGAYAPELQDKESYQITSAQIDTIKQKASEYAINQGFLMADNTDLKKLFEDYTYDYHFLWPKLSDVNIIAYPAPGFPTYLDIVSFGQQLAAEGNLAALAGDESTGEGGLYDLLEKYLSEFIRVDDGLRTTSSENSGTALSSYYQTSDYYNQVTPVATSDPRYTTKAEQTYQSNPINDQLKYIQQLGQNYRQLQADSKLGTYSANGVGGKGVGTSSMDLSNTKTNGLSAASTLGKLNSERNKDKEAFNKANLQSSNSSGGKNLAAAKKLLTKEALSPSKNASGLADDDIATTNSTNPIGMGVVGPMGGLAGGGSAASSAAPVNDGGYLDGDHSDANSQNAYRIDDAGLGSFESSTGEYGNQGPSFGNSNLTENGMQAIDYKNLVQSANAYQAGSVPSANHDLTLWDIVTNAYFRSYKNLIDTRHIEVKKEDKKP